MYISPWQCRILKPHSSPIRDDLRGSKPRMHSFEAMWSIYCSSFKRCAIRTDKLFSISLARLWWNARGRSALVSDNVGEEFRSPQLFQRQLVSKFRPLAFDHRAHLL
jgi:hypothetical protein